MPRVRLTVAAQQDLIDIQEQGWATFGLAAAGSHMQGFEAVFTLLRAYPGAGEARRTMATVSESFRIDRTGSCIMSPTGTF
jgi:plasmid stabilization system protein ParE